MIQQSNPLISVIVPVYNSARYLDRCVESILSQTYTNFEILLIDDGSTDASATKCDFYIGVDDRVRTFHKLNGGPSSARNVGMDNSRGEWITFCDSDDWVLPNWLEDFVVNIAGFDLVCQGIRFDKSIVANQIKCEDVGVAFKGETHILLDKMFEIGVVGYVFSKCFNKAIISKYNLRFDERFRFREDEEFVLRYLTHCSRALSINTVGYNYIEPDFDNKYGFDINGYELSVSLYKSSMEISTGIETNYSIKLKNDITSYFVQEFLNLHGFYQKRKRLLEYRQTLNYHLMSLNIYYPTKFLINVDCTGVISTIILSLHLRLKYKAHLVC